MKLCMECGKGPVSRKYCKDCSPIAGKRTQARWARENRSRINRNQRRRRKQTTPQQKAEHAKYMKGYRQTEAYKAANRKRTTTPQYRAKVRERSITPINILMKRIKVQVRRVLVEYVQKGRKIKGTMRHLSYTPIELVNHLAGDWPDGFPEDIENYHIDHIIPINHYKEQGKLESVEDIAACFALENLRLITASENLLKGKKVIR